MRCKICNIKFVPTQFLQKCCSIEHSIEWVRLNKDKIAKVANSFERKATKETKEKIKGVGELKSELQEWVNKIVRLIDKNLLCLAKNKGGQIHAGHIFARGGNSTIRYNLHNIHRQNAQSNHFQNDDGLLREGLVKEYGQAYMDFVSELRQTPILKYYEDDYREFIIKAKTIEKRLRKLDLEYSLEERLRLRSELNLELGIYSENFCIYGGRLVIWGELGR